MSYIGSIPAIENISTVPINSVETQDIQNSAVTTEKIANAAVTADKIAAGAAVPTQTGQTGKYLTTDGTNASWATLVAGPSISSLVYSGNDQATDTTSPLPVTIIGSGFVANTKVYIDTVTNANSATALQFSGTTQITFTPPAKSAASYNVWVVTPDGKMAVLVNGILYSGTPSWAGVATTYNSLTAVSIQLTATSADTPLVYTLVSGTLPTGVTLSSSGLLSGTVTGLTADTNFPNIVIRADDPQNQDASITIQLNIQVKQQISRSLRFNSADSAYLTRTPSVAGNRKTWTWSSWVKRSNLGSDQTIFEVYNGANDNQTFNISWSSGDVISIGAYNVFWLRTAATYRDTSAWYHIVCAVDTTQATADNRIRLYVNGSEVTVFGTRNNPSQNADLSINQAAAHYIGSRNANSLWLNGYLTEVNFIDGQQLTHTSFGETDPDTGVWRPKRYVGTYGTNGFYLNFADNTSATSLTLGKDTSSSGINRIELGNTSSGYTVLGTMTFTALLSANAVNLRDGNTSTFAADPNALNNGTTMGYDFGIAVPVRRIVTITAGTYGVDTSTTMNIQYSDDNSTWTTVTGATTQHSITAGLGITNTTNISDNGSHRYWRLAVANGAPTGGNFWFSTLDMYASGIGPNGWYPINFSVASGVGNDSVVDSPTSYGTDTGLGGEVRGNYATWSPVDKSSIFTLTNGNLDCAQSAGSGSIRGTIAVSSGKWYWEITVGTNNTSVGIALVSATLDNYVGGTVGTAGFNMTTGLALINSPFSSVNGASIGGFTTNDIIGLALDFTAGTLKFYKNGTLITANHLTNVSGLLAPAIGSNEANTGYIANFGQRPFAYSAPSGFKALCTQNLPTPTIGATSSTQASKFFNTVLYTADTAGGKTISGVGFQPDFTWIKNRDNVESHYLVDAVRGTGTSKYLKSNSASDEGGAAAGDCSFAFTSDGFTLTDANYNTGEVYFNGRTYASWNWKAGDSNVTNTQGSITSTVRANTTAGFSIVSYTGTGNAGGTVGHGLGTTPALIIVKARNFGGATNWVVWSNQFSSPTSNVLLLNTSDGTLSINNYWSASPPNSSVFGVNNGAWDNNHNGVSFIAYCFAEVPGYSRFGSYAGNGGADGPFVYCGFRPAFIMFKRSSGSGNDWRILDSKRTPYNQGNQALYPNGNNTEASAANDAFDILSNGFKMRGTAQASNESGSTYIFAAFAETPFKYALAR